MKTSELIGGRLDYWVAKAEGRAVDYHNLGAHGGDFVTVVDPEQSGWVSWSPSRVWADGGPIIEREGLGLKGPDSVGEWGQWRAWPCGKMDDYCGGTPLIAAMRAYVASKFGDEVVDKP